MLTVDEMRAQALQRGEKLSPHFVKGRQKDNAATMETIKRLSEAETLPLPQAEEWLKEQPKGKKKRPSKRRPKNC
jgi:hypothetical protein